MNLRELLERAAAELADVEVDQAPDGTTWSRAGISFAVLSSDGLTAAFRLETGVAAAATRTPDTEPSDRGPGWVEFRPRVLDDHAADRAAAWLGSAHRRLSRG